MRNGKTEDVSARGVTRREMLKALCALAASATMPAAFAQSGMSAGQFNALSSAATGYAYTDAAVVSSMLRALTQAVGGDKLARLARIAASTPPAQWTPALRSANLETAAETVVAALYSGIVDTPRGPRVISYDQALVWQALPWTKPNAFCGGQTDYWSSAPST